MSTPLDAGEQGTFYPATPAQALPSTFNATRLVHELYGSLCPHDSEQGEGSLIFNEPAYTCSRCIETMAVRAYLIGVGSARRAERDLSLGAGTDAGGGDPG